MCRVFRGCCKSLFALSGEKAQSLKPLEFADFFVGLKPHANPQKQPRDFFGTLFSPQDLEWLETQAFGLRGPM